MSPEPHKGSPRQLTHRLRVDVVKAYLREIGGPTRGYLQKHFAENLAEIGVLPGYKWDSKKSTVRQWLNDKRPLAEDDANAVARVLSDKLQLDPPLDLEHVAKRRDEDEYDCSEDELDEVPTSINDEAFSLPLERRTTDVAFFSQGYRGVALELLKHHHRIRGGGGVRIVAFTGHTLTELMVQLLGECDTTIQACFATATTARNLRMLRQVELMEEFLSPAGLADLADYLVSSPRQLTFHWMSDEPTATAIALGQDVFCWNAYRKVDVAVQRSRRREKGRAEVAHLPPADVMSISGVDQAALLAVRPRQGVPSPLFDHVQRDFEQLWATATASSRSPDPMGGVAEMNEMLEQAVADLRQRRK